MLKANLYFFVCLSRFHDKTNQEILLNFGMELFWTQEKWIGYFLSQKFNSKGVKLGLKVVMVIYL